MFCHYTASITELLINCVFESCGMMGWWSESFGPSMEFVWKDWRRRIKVLSRHRSLKPGFHKARVAWAPLSVERRKLIWTITERKHECRQERECKLKKTKERKKKRRKRAEDKANKARHYTCHGPTLCAQWFIPQLSCKGDCLPACTGAGTQLPGR